MAHTNLKTGLFLQARISSTRLPGKALLDLAGKPVLFHVMEALRAIRTTYHVLVTDEESYPLFQRWATRAGFAIMVGPKEDVLARYCLACDKYGVDWVVRATGDNPLVSARQAKLLLVLHGVFRSQLSYFQGAPLGTGVEVVTTEALKTAFKQSTDPYEHEHITTYILRRPKEFRILALRAPWPWYYPAGRVTLDTRQDYEYLKRLYEELYKSFPIPTGRLVRWLKKNPHP